ncbi:MAG: ABC transporter substrate-binding protein [Rhizobiaceae bacterium]|nr:ABC transporter substrate-binding protein [Rhizobiaceae bacterium]
MTELRSLALTLAAILSSSGSALPQDAVPVRIGIAAPATGASAILGAQVFAGARAAAMGKTGVSIVEADTECSLEGGTRAADALIAANVDAVAGFICTEEMAAALPLLTKAGIPVVAVGVRANRFTDRRRKTGYLVWRLAPRSDAEADAIAALLATRWREVPFGIVDDGTLYGRGLADAVRTRVEAQGMRPATIDTFRPAEEKQFGLVRRILGTGVTRLFIAGDRQDVAIIARDAASLDLALEIVGGEALLDEPNPDVPLMTGVTALAPLSRFDAIPAAEATSPDARFGYFGPAVAATEIAAAAVRSAKTSAREVSVVLGATRFDTALGAVGFDAEGDSDLDLFRSYRFDGTDFVVETGG